MREELTARSDGEPSLQKKTARTDALQLELGPPPVTTLRVVLDFVFCDISDPRRNGQVLFHLFGELDLDAESFVGRHSAGRTFRKHPMPMSAMSTRCR